MTVATPASSAALSRDTRTALVNAVKLSLSLGVTWTIGLVVRFWLPRHLGPELFGVLTFADGLTATVLGCTGLGFDYYIAREIPIRPRHASDFYGGAMAVRTALSAALIAGLLVVPLGQQHPVLPWLLLLFGCGYLFYSLTASLAGLLQANGTVDELAVSNVMGKVAWGAGMIGAILLGLPVAWMAGAFALSEGLKFVYLQHVARRRLTLEIRLDVAATWAVMRKSVGFFANSIAFEISWRLGVALLGFLASPAEIGWYGAAQSLANIALMLAPILNAVLMPLLARAHSRSPEEMFAVVRRALEGLIALTLPVALMLSLGADLWTFIAFGRAYAPAAATLAMLAPLFVLMYFSILVGSALVVHNRGWRLTWITITGTAVHAGAAFVFVPLLSSRMGDGGAGAGMALAAVLKEIYVLGSMLSTLGWGVVDRARWQMILRSVLAAGAATLAHFALAPIGLWRLPVDLAVYLAVAVALGALKPRALLALVQEVRSSRAGASAPSERSH
jgi:O-antigen/teichoic acid export membrane protein